MKYFFKKITQWIIPHVCLLCGTLTQQAYDLCLACSHALPSLANSCVTCANHLPLAIASAKCGQCLQNPPPFDETYSLFSYKPPAIKLILDLKFHHQFAHAQLLGELLTEKIKSLWYHNQALPTAIIPVPLHVARLKERGFNQAVEIARPIHSQLHIPLLLHSVTRNKPTLPQTMLSAKERMQNVRHAFQVHSSFTGQHIAIVDDVITTGSTVYEVAKQLKKKGAAKVSVWCCARRI